MNRGRGRGSQDYAEEANIILGGRGRGRPDYNEGSRAWNSRGRGQRRGSGAPNTSTTYPNETRHSGRSPTMPTSRAYNREENHHTITNGSVMNNQNQNLEVEGMQNNREQPQQQAGLENFFYFTTRPLPVIPKPPERWSRTNPPELQVRKVDNPDPEREHWRVPTTAFIDDDNKHYVGYYKKIVDDKVLEMQKLTLTDVEEIENKKARPKVPKKGGGDGDMGSTILGSFPGVNKTLDDPEVFWKYDMKNRKVDTSHLVINSYKQKILNQLNNRQVLVVEGFTGCGKTTQVPQIILDDAVEKNNRVRIAVTQPRRIAAMSVASRVCDERGWSLGSLVGYQVGMDRRVGDDTRIIYMTTGVLLQLLIGKKNLSEYTHIIIDEVHERDLETDLLMLVIKKIMIDRHDVDIKIVLMSATLDTTKFMDYFPVFNKNNENSSTSIKVTQPSIYPIEELYLDNLVSKYGLDGFDLDGSEEPRVFNECYELCGKIINSLDYQEYQDECKKLQVPMERMSEEERSLFNTSEFFKLRSDKAPTRGAVLVFLPGFMEIDTMYKQLIEICGIKSGSFDSVDVSKWLILPLHSSITSEEQQKVFRPAETGFRKIILATNIAESSITVPDIRYVIDFCLTKSLSCDPTTNFSCLRLEWASKNQCIQRRGRCGRVAPGICYRLISNQFYYSMQQEALPEMEKASLESVILNVKQLGMGCPLEILALAIDPPKQSGIGRAVANLKEVGALTLAVDGAHDAYDGDLTFMGNVMAKLPIDFRLGRLIVLGYVFGCVDDTIIIAAGLSTKSPFSHPYIKRLEAYLSKFGWSSRTYSDCFALLNCYNRWDANHRGRLFRSNGEERNWARTYFVQLSVLREMKHLIEEIKRRLDNVGIQSDSKPINPIEKGFILKLVIAGAFYPNYFTRSRPCRKEFEREIIREVGGFNPLHSVTLLGFPIDQPGELYAKHIADKMTCTNAVPNVNFRSSKVIVTFDPRGDKVGSISYGVYRAVKMRMLRERLTFYTLPREESKRAHTLADQYFIDNPITRAPLCVSYPSITESQFDCFVAHGESAQEFYIVRESDRIKLDQINAILNQEGPDGKVKRFPTLPETARVPGGICLFIKAGRYLRGRIECLTVDQAMVYSIDTGVQMWKSFRHLYHVTDDMIARGLLKFPALAMPSRIAFLKPACRYAYDWQIETGKDFIEFVGECVNGLSTQVFSMKVYSVVDGIVSGELFSPRLIITCTEHLQKTGYVEKTEEQQDSRDNAESRRLCPILRYDEITIKAIDIKQLPTWNPTRYFMPPILDAEVGVETILRGPSSPLEINFHSLCRSAHMKMVQVEGNSVNCVALDTEPFNSVSRVIIAASVGIAHRSGNILARETTLMPPIPGLLALLTMTFAPKIEFRVNDDRTAYTGCISGLGTDPEEKKPVYPDHDMEIIFDVLIDNSDLDLINSIRMTLNFMLREQVVGHREIESIREKVREEIILLMQRQRETIEDVWPDHTHVWNRLDAPRLHLPSPDYEIMDNDVFSLHTGILLDPPNEDEFTRLPKNVFKCPDETPF